jgi:glycosyltransferase involved in cell wall biosynthesis
MPFFSVIIPTFNRINTLPQTINSVLEQSYTDFEVIIADDGSTDSTDTWAKSIKDPRVNYYYQHNMGVCAARNLGLSYAQGSYICFLDSDDSVTINWLHDFHKTISIFLNTDIVFCDGVKQYENGEEITIKSNYPYNPKVKDDGGIYLAGLFAIKSEWFERIGRFDEQLKFGEFTDLGFRIKKYEIITAFTNNIGMYYRISAEGGGKNLKNKIDSNLYFINKHKNYFSDKQLEHQIFLHNIAVSYLKLNDFFNGRKYLLKSFIIRFWNIKIFIRLILSFFPFLYKKIFH